MAIELLTVSSKGQVVLPASMRKTLAIETGSKLAAYATDDLIMLKVVRIPTAEDFAAKLDEAKAWAASVGYQEADVEPIIKEVRQKRRK